MVKEQDVNVVVPITVTGPRHCSNSCRFMKDAEPERRGEFGGLLREARPAACLLGQTPVQLTWDTKRKQHGYKRTMYCRANEL